MAGVRRERVLELYSETLFAYKEIHMEKYIKYVEVSEQIKKLKKQGLIIPDEKETASYLEIFGYI